jgi:formate dehydrogenase maturation protein FdhE
MNNPMQFMNMLKGIKNPKEAVINMVKSNNNPMVKNLVEMAEKGDNQGVEKFARNIFKEQGRDFDSEKNQFMNNFK